MPFIKIGTLLEDWQSPNPITLLGDIELPELELIDDFIEREYGGRKGVMAINYNRKDKSAPYFACCRGAWGMHTDPGYNRYAHHIVLKACNAKLTGYLDDYQVSAQQLLILDSHSPHALMPATPKEEVFFLSLAQDLTEKNINFVESINLEKYLNEIRRCITRV
ncbi:hypothetical protein [Microcoleus sp. B5-C4]|uniref:hypothetical protein n=1 Tax=Microcoleus sp. B5-C4 TaxID=2818675 RepID=UPI002FD65255